jgi:hypothetical protein
MSAVTKAPAMIQYPSGGRGRWALGVRTSRSTATRAVRNRSFYSSHLTD